MEIKDVMSHPLVTRIAAVAVGSTISVGAMLWFISSSNIEIGRSFTGNGPVGAVLERLPQVAVVGHKLGPADTTEVFIQVPGVLNMQSVYVLADNETVISGFIVPKLQGGVPGGQMEMPTGQPTVDPRAERTNMAQLMKLLAKDEHSESDVPALKTPAEQTLPVHQEIPAPRKRQDEQASVEGVSAIEHTAAEVSIPPSKAEPSAARVSPGKTGSSETRIGAIENSAQFRKALMSTLESRGDLGSVRNATTPKSQQEAYLALVKDRPAIIQGAGPRHIYVLFDPNCPVCHAYYSEVSSDAKAGRVTVHWIPAVVFPDKRSSITAGAELLRTMNEEGQSRARDVFHRMMTERGFNAELDAGFADNAKTGEYLDEVLANSGTMVMARAETPLLIYETDESKLIIDGGIPQGGYIQSVKVE